jgi:ribosomal protein L44E
MNRSERRALKKNHGAEASEKIANKISQFNKMPETCSACNEPFDKQDKEMLQSWSVVVRQEVVRLFCPECIRKTQEAIESVSKKDNEAGAR